MAGQIHKILFLGRRGSPPWQAWKALKELSHFQKPLGWFFIHNFAMWPFLNLFR
jgi:hypothetical protein